MQKKIETDGPAEFFSAGYPKNKGISNNQASPLSPADRAKTEFKKLFEFKLKRYWSLSQG